MLRPPGAGDTKDHRPEPWAPGNKGRGKWLLGLSVGFPSASGAPLDVLSFHRVRWFLFCS